VAQRDPKTEWLRVQGYRAMTPQRRFEIAQSMILTGRKTVEHAIREQNPDLSAREFEIELWNRIYDRAWASRIAALPRRKRQAMQDWQIVAQVVRVLEAGDIPYAIVGGYSSIYWGRPRFTQDADILTNLTVKDITRVVEGLSADFVVSESAVRDAVRAHGEFNLIHQAEVFKVDIWVAEQAPYPREVLKRRRRGTLGEEPVYFQSPEDTILSKLRWCKLANRSERQFTDALSVYEIQLQRLDQTYLDHWAQLLDVADLLQEVRAQAALPPDEGDG